MFSTDANPFGNVTVQPWHATTTSEAAVRAPERLLLPETAFVLPKQEAPRPNQQNNQPNPMVLFSNALGFSNVATYLFGNKATSSTSTNNKPGTTSFVESAGWDDEIDPLTGLPRVVSAQRNAPLFMDENESPFSRSLDILI